MNRGFAILGERLFLVSQDAHLTALDRRSGVVLWDVELADYRVTPAAMTVIVKPTAYSKYRIQFIGEGGALLQETLDSSATYAFNGRERYVRAKVLESNGAVAWCQPAFPADVR